MTLYMVIYYNAGTWNTSQVILSLSDAENAFAWFQTLNGTTYTAILSWNTTTVNSWGVAPV